MSFTPVITENPINPDWIRVTQSFGKADLQTHPSTEEVMAHFSDDAVFTRSHWPTVGKKIASFVFKYFCEKGVLEYRKTEALSIEEKQDHVLWKFQSIQYRRGLLPTWIMAPKWYRVNYEAKLTFSGQGENTKICGFETLRNDFAKIPTPE